MRTEPQVAAKAEMLAVLDSPTEDGCAAEAAVGTDGAPAPAALPPASLLLASVGHHQPTYELDDDEDEEGDRYRPLHSNGPGSIEFGIVIDDNHAIMLWTDTRSSMTMMEVRSSTAMVMARRVTTPSSWMRSRSRLLAKCSARLISRRPAPGQSPAANRSRTFEVQLRPTVFSSLSDFVGC